MGICPTHNPKSTPKALENITCNIYVSWRGGPCPKQMAAAVFSQTENQNAKVLECTNDSSHTRVMSKVTYDAVWTDDWTHDKLERTIPCRISLCNGHMKP